MSDENDIELLKKAISGQIPLVKATMDINGDGVVNSRDLVELIRAVRYKPTTTSSTLAATTSTTVTSTADTTSARIAVLRAEREKSRFNTDNLKKPLSPTN